MSTHLSPAQIHSRLKHPVVDADGHWLEFVPVFSEKMRKAVSDKAADGFRAAMHTTTEQLKMTQRIRDERRVAMPNFWNRQAENTLDRATAMMPKMLLRAARRDRHRFRRHLSDGRLASAAHQGRRDTPRRHSRLQHRVRRLFPRLRRSHDTGRHHSDAHA